MFSNKPELGVNYTWSVKERMPGSKSTVTNSIGWTAGHSLYEYRIDDRPTFSPRYPGKYVLNLHAEFNDGTTAQHDFEIYVGGSALPDDTGGCSTIPGGNSSPANLLFLGVIVILGLHRFRGERRT